MIHPTLQNFDKAIKSITKEVEHPELNELCQQFGDLLKQFRQGQLVLINELYEMYDSASEHNVDIGRDAISQLAQRLASVESTTKNEATDKTLGLRE
jgi:hypothetical protein